MAKEQYQCGSCDFTAESYNFTNGNCCTKCSDVMILRKVREEVSSRRPRRRRKDRLSHLDPTMRLIVMKAERELLDIRESEEIHFMKRKKKLYEEDVRSREAYKRKTEKAPVVFHAYDARPPGEIHENESLFEGIEVRRIDPLDHTDHQEDYDVPEFDDNPDVPFGVLIGLERM